jgi:hypothetical protein
MAADDPKAPRPKAAQKELAPKLVTIQREKIRLREALKEVAKQTDIEVVDRRRKEADDPQLKLDFKNVTFWQALDTIAKEADLRVYVHGGARSLALVDGPNVQLPICYSGLFRIVVRRMTAVHDLETDLRFCLASLEVAWEPQFRPLLLESRPQGLVVQDENKTDLHAEDGSGGKGFVDSEKIATTLDLHLPAPARKVTKLGLLKGTLSFIGSTKMLTFEFDTVAKEKAAKEPKQTKEGVTVRLRKIDLTEKTHWTVVVNLDYPGDGPHFESFQSWVGSNEIHLKKTDVEGKVTNNGHSVDSLGSNKAVITYYFTEQLKKKLGGGKPEDWKIVYRAPAPFVEVPVPFEFKDVPLP